MRLNSLGGATTRNGEGGDESRLDLGCVVVSRLLCQGHPIVE